MKNIHVLPTDKPSRLYKSIDNELSFTDIEFEQGGFNKNQNIYITSDEEIKEWDWMIRDNEQPTLVTPNFFWDFGVRYYKIILTTNQELIKDGVQAIDDDFLKWFVKNQSCEGVDVYNDKSVGYEYDHYSIIIPKEKTKQEKLLQVAERYSANELSQLGFINGAKWQEQQTIEEVFEWLTTNNYLTDLKEILINNFKNK